MRTLPGSHAGALATESLRPFASPAGAISMLALDHRDALRNAFARAGVADPSEDAMLEVKARIAGVLAAVASSILLDALAVRHLRPPGLGLLMPLEAQGHDALERGRVNRLLEDFGPADAAALGAHGCKLLLYYRADHLPSAERQHALVRRVAADCHRVGLPLIVEPIVYPLSGETACAYAFADLVAAAAHDLAGSGADLLKLQYPGSLPACERVSEAAAPLAWTLLGGSDADAATFAVQLRAACAAGASGFIAGRAIWGGVLARERGDQLTWLTENARPAMEQLVTIADTYSRRLP